jgi:hypothetical protein
MPSACQHRFSIPGTRRAADRDDRGEGAGDQRIVGRSGLRPHRYPDSHVLSGTRVPTQGLLLFGRGSGRIASPAQRERPPTAGRRVRVRPGLNDPPLTFLGANSMNRRGPVAYLDMLR